MTKSSSDTPLMQQHRAIKQKFPDAILLFRVGDFYETFGQDAIIASQVLGITLTKRNNGLAGELELAGFPYHALDTYLHKLVKAQYRVAICDQLEDPKQAKGIVKRGVTEMVSPGTAVGDKLLEHDANNFLAAICMSDAKDFGLAFFDISTGEFFVAQGNAEYADKLIQSFKPAEIIYPRNHQKYFKEFLGEKTFTYTLDEWVYASEVAEQILLKHFQTHSLKGFGIDDLVYGKIAAGAIFHYLKETEHPNLQHITQLQRIYQDDFLWMDRFTIRNLELTANASENNKTLLSVLDSTSSPMGARLLRRWIIFPLSNIIKINERLKLTEHLILNQTLKQFLEHAIKQCGDIERLASKISLKKVNPREVLQVAKSLNQVMEIKNKCLNDENDFLQRLTDALNPCKVIADKILQVIIDSPAVNLSKGGVIKGGYHPDLDELRSIAHSGKEYLAKLQAEEIEKTGITSLKVGFNNVFGYYLEVTNSHKSKAPEHWIRKQTLANAERYVTPKLKEYEEKILGAEDKIVQLEQQLYETLITELLDYLPAMQLNGNIIATLDCICCFAQNALKYRYKKPSLHTGDEWKVVNSRHPVIEQNLAPGESYIANDIILDKQEQQIIILTGPNMSGKSALLRQVALITIMAHIGSFVPADEALIPLTDKIFTRVGASDNISSGESTFMVEMNETASILNNLTGNSLIILDEIGRGTSTYDGISIAWSITEFIHQSPHQPKTLFATHYHELNELEERLPRVKNFHITHKESGNQIVFLRKLARGGSVHSFGIHVARMAGMPASLIERANEVLQKLEAKAEKGAGKAMADKLKSLPEQKIQLSIFDVHTQTFDEIRKVLTNTDINRLTPVEALLKLNEIKNMIK